jgi:hypothetical protein
MKLDRERWRHARIRAFRVATHILGLSFLALPLAPVTAQTPTGPSSSSTYQEPFLEPPPSVAQPSAVKPLRFELETEIPLPGPLPGDPPRLLEGRIELPVAGGVAVTDWRPDSVPRILAPEVVEPPAAEGDGWVLAPDGKKRYRALPTGFLEAQKRCRGCKDGWRRKWKLRIGGAAIVPPVVTHHRIYFGALDDRVYAITRRGGHRLWDADVGSRVNRPLVLMTVSDPGLLSDAEQARRLAQSSESGDEGKKGEKRRRKDSEVALLLCVPGSARELMVLDAVTGTILATFKLPNSEEKLIGHPVITPDGRIVVARQKYSPENADLMVFRLQEAGGSPNVPYNTANGSEDAAGS